MGHAPPPCRSAVRPRRCGVVLTGAPTRRRHRPDPAPRPTRGTLRRQRPDREHEHPKDPHEHARRRRAQHARTRDQRQDKHPEHDRTSGKRDRERPIPRVSRRDRTPRRCQQSLTHDASQTVVSSDPPPEAGGDHSRAYAPRPEPDHDIHNVPPTRGEPPARGVLSTRRHGPTPPEHSCPPRTRGASRVRGVGRLHPEPCSSRATPPRRTTRTPPPPARWTRMSTRTARSNASWSGAPPSRAASARV